MRFPVGLGQTVVEASVEAHVGEPIARRRGLGSLAVDLSKRLERARRRRRSEASGEALHRFPHHVELGQVSRRQTTNANALVRQELHHVVCEEPTEGFSNGGPADAELGGELLFDQMNAGKDLAAQDPFADRGDELIGDRGSNPVSQDQVLPDSFCPADPAKP